MKNPTLREQAAYIIKRLTHDAIMRVNHGVEPGSISLHQIVAIEDDVQWLTRRKLDQAPAPEGAGVRD